MKHKVTTDALETLGTLIDENAGRDAIHLAVEPIIAGEPLMPGWHVGLKEGKAVTDDAVKKVGIVDPFLKKNILRGERFWLIVYPRTITSLRHVWSHPDFQDEPTVELSVRINPSEQWIRDFAARVGLKYDILMQGARDWVEDKKQGGYGEYLCFGSLLDGEYVPDEFWDHFQVVEGIAVEEIHRGSFFTCSC